MKDLLTFAWQVADGIVYLTGKNCIHRDVAARNVLITAAKTAKICDFGLCRLPDHTVYVSHGGQTPIKWMAIESLQDQHYTELTDVWSYGILLWEIWSLGQVPYDWLDQRQVLQFLWSGERMAQPEHASDEM